MSTYAIKMNGADGSTYLPVTSTSLIQHKYGSSTDKLTSYLGSYIGKSEQTFKKTNSLYPIPLSNIDASKTGTQIKDFYWNHKLRFNPSLSTLMIGQNGESEPGSSMEPLPSYIKISSAGLEMYNKTGSGTSSVNHFGTLTPDYYSGTSAYADYVNNLDLDDVPYVVEYQLTSTGSITCAQTFSEIAEQWDNKKTILGKIVKKDGNNSDVWPGNVNEQTNMLSYFRNNTMLCSYYYGTSINNNSIGGTFYFDCGLHPNVLGNQYGQIDTIGENVLPNRKLFIKHQANNVITLGYEDFATYTHTHNSGTIGIVHLVTESAATSSTKVCTGLNGIIPDNYSNFTLRPGVIISVRFINGHNYYNSVAGSGLSLNVLNTGAINVRTPSSDKESNKAKFYISPGDVLLFQLNENTQWEFLSSEQSMYKTNVIADDSPTSYSYISGKSITSYNYEKVLLTYSPSISFSGSGELFSTYFNENGTRLENKYAQLSYSLTDVYEVHFIGTGDVEGNNELVTCDRTLAEIDAAWAAGKRIIGVITSINANNDWVSKAAPIILDCTKSALMGRYEFDKFYFNSITETYHLFHIGLNSTAMSSNEILLYRLDLSSKFSTPGHALNTHSTMGFTTRYNRNDTSASVTSILQKAFYHAYFSCPRTQNKTLDQFGHWYWSSNSGGMNYNYIYYATDYDTTNHPNKLGSCLAVQIDKLAYFPEDADDLSAALEDVATADGAVPTTGNRTVFYCVIFLAGVDDMPITLPPNYKWKDNIIPDIYQGWQYELVLYNNIATLIGTNPSGTDL